MPKNNNDFIAMEKLICPICGKLHKYDSAILINTKLEKIKDKDLPRNFGKCKECDDLSKEYVALIEVENPEDNRYSLKQSDAIRTGRIMHMKRKVFPEFFQGHSKVGDMAFINKDAFEQLAKMEKDSNDAAAKKKDKPN